MADQIQLEVRQTSATTSEATIRDHQVRFDRPVSKGGANEGPMGGEVFLASVAGCFLSNLLAAMRARESRLSNVHVAVTGTLEGPPARFTAIDLLVSADNRAGNPEEASLEKLTEIAARGCIMVNTLQDKLRLTVRLA